MNKHSMNNRVPKLITLLIIMGSITAFAGVSQANGLVIRAGQCSAEAFKNGSGVHVSAGGKYISNLSVNCTEATSNPANYNQYLNGIGGYANYCVTTIDKLTRVMAKLSQDPVRGNPFHCLLSGDPKKIASKLTRR